jgi:hypothetical protein
MYKAGYMPCFLHVEVFGLACQQAHCISGKVSLPGIVFLNIFCY